MNPATFIENPDVILIGSGVMSANLGALLKRLDPALRIQLYEVTDQLAQESSHGWNNAGTGHAGICELSYTSSRGADGRVDIRKAVEIFDQFERTLQFWSHAVAGGMVERPAEFISPVPHMSFVRGAEQVDFLRSRYEGLSGHHFFEDMVFSTEREVIGRWAPLLLDGRADEPVAATRMEGGTDVNFGELSRKLLAWLGGQEGCRVATGQRVTGLKRTGSLWEVTVRDTKTGETRTNRAKFVFIGAGGGSLHLLQNSGIPEGRGIGGFPVGGQWLVCENPEVVSRHEAKVYGQALGAAPTMAVPHLDTRILDGKKTLLFGPFAAWTTKFLHRGGSWTDLPFSLRPDNIATLLQVGAHNLDLVRYLVQQGTQSLEDRVEALREFYPAARAADWQVREAGIRVQAIKKTDGQAGIVHYGTEVVTDKGRTVAALLGASPGASICVHIALEIVETCFPRLAESPMIREIFPSYGRDLKSPENAGLFRSTHQTALQTLDLLH